MSLIRNQNMCGAKSLSIESRAVNWIVMVIICPLLVMAMIGDHAETNE